MGKNKNTHTKLCQSLRRRNSLFGFLVIGVLVTAVPFLVNYVFSLLGSRMYYFFRCQFLSFWSFELLELVTSLPNLTTKRRRELLVLIMFSLFIFFFFLSFLFWKIKMQSWEGGRNSY